jgi:hypothetical protein
MMAVKENDTALPKWLWSIRALRNEIKPHVLARNSLVEQLTTLNAEVCNRAESITGIESSNAKAIRDAVDRLATGGVA